MTKFDDVSRRLTCGHKMLIVNSHQFLPFAQNTKDFECNVQLLFANVSVPHLHKSSKKPGTELGTRYFEAGPGN